MEPAAPNHAEDYHAYYARNREHLAMWEPQRPESFYTPEGARAALDAWLRYASSGHDVRFFVYEGLELVGMVDLFDVQFRPVHRRASIGYSIDAQQQRKGYATEAAAAVVRYAFETLGVHRIETTYAPSNEASGRVLRKLGFVIEGYARDFLYLNGRWRDAIRVAKFNAAAGPP